MPSARSRRSTPNPSMPGIITSRITASGRTSRARSSAAAPLTAVCTSKPWNFRLTESNSTMFSSSSTTRIRASGSDFSATGAVIPSIRSHRHEHNFEGRCELAVSTDCPRRRPGAPIPPVQTAARPYTGGMDLGKNLAEAALAPAKIGLAAADAGLGVATAALGVTKRALGADGPGVSTNSMAGMLGLEEAITRANRLARLMDDDAPLGRALAPGGPVDRLLADDGLIDQLTAPGGVIDRLTEEGGGLQRALQPGGLVDQLLDEDGLVERVLAEDGVADRLMADGGLGDKLTARNGPLEQLANVADTLSRLAPGMEALEPAIETLQEAVIALTLVVNPLSNIAERIPLLPRRGGSRRSATTREVRSARIVAETTPGAGTDPGPEVPGPR